MANTVNGNSIYIDTAGAISDTNGALVMAIILTPTSANGIIKLEDTSTTNVLIDLRAATSGESKFIDLSGSPLVFANGVTVDTITNAVATLITRRRGTNGGS